ncbi:MAG TPA: hypothetical protein VN368_00965 [Candidatus Methylomirabilis sp.]|nr:hypothetical protein [Candidatus Methylomirabilis sp.]
MTTVNRIIANALVIAGITFFSNLSVQYPPAPQSVWAAFIAGCLALLTQLRGITDSESESKEEEQKPKRPLGMLI